MSKNPKKLWTVDPREALRAGEGFRLAALDRNGTPGWEGSKKDAKSLMATRAELLPELQERLFAEGRTGGKRAVLCVIQGLDTAGKGGIVRHVMGYVDPQGVALHSFGVPSAEERKHHYLWRIRKALPPAGRIGVFDRSHYEDVLVVRVNELVPEEEWQKRYEEINKFEADLVASGTIVLKFALMVSHAEQGLRLMERLDRSDKHWKYTTGDLQTRSKWPEFQTAYQAVFERTSTEHAPWYVLPADHKWYSRLAITEILTRTLSEMQLTFPKADWDVADERRKLAESMSTQTLAQSLAETRDNVESAMNESFEVRQEVAAFPGVDDQTAQRTATDSREAWAAELDAAITQKKELLAERPDYTG
ncbi:MAG: polyphosphate kinase 2 family protein [Propionibacteriaceae bacterium]|nr:polyphosphate kinase 2 family protein [Propionibacteriaceae bacterium]